MLLLPNKELGLRVCSETGLSEASGRQIMPSSTIKIIMTMMMILPGGGGAHAGGISSAMNICKSIYYSIIPSRTYSSDNVDYIR